MKAPFIPSYIYDFQKTAATTKHTISTGKNSYPLLWIIKIISISILCLFIILKIVEIGMTIKKASTRELITDVNPSCISLFLAATVKLIASIEQPPHETRVMPINTCDN